MEQFLYNPFITANDVRRMIHLQNFIPMPVQDDVQVAVQHGVADRDREKTQDQAAFRAESAAIARTRQRLSQHEHREFGGFILRDALGRYTFTVPITFEEEGKFHPLREVAPRGFTVVAEYHTHPTVTSAEGQGFSTADGRHYEQYQRVGYVADTFSKKMYRFNPGHTINRSAWEGVIGDLVGNLP